MLARLRVILCFQYSVTRAFTLASAAGSWGAEGAAGAFAAAGAGAGLGGAAGLSLGVWAAADDAKAREAPMATRKRRSIRRSSFKGTLLLSRRGNASALPRRAERIGPE
jgi:hypothetical protein